MLNKFIFAGAFAAFAAVGHAQFTPIYQNTTNFTGSGFQNGGADATSVSRLVADDINFTAGNAGKAVTRFNFSVANFNTTATNARALVRFYGTDGASGGPGTLLGGLNFNPISFAANSVQLFTFTNAAGIFTVPTSGNIWAGISFDNLTTNTTVAQLNNLGQGIFNPPTVGSSADVFFQSTAAGSFPSSNPAGSFFNFSGNPVGNFGWGFEVAAVPEPTSIVALSLGGLALLRRRRKVNL